MKYKMRTRKLGMYVLNVKNELSPFSLANAAFSMVLLLVLDICDFQEPPPHQEEFQR